MRFSSTTFIGLLLIILVAGGLFLMVSLHMMNDYFCPLIGGKACEGLGEIAGLMLHISHSKIIFLSLLPILFSAAALAVTYSLSEKQLDTRATAWVSLRIAEKARHEQPLHLERWLTLHTNSPNL